MSLVTPDFFYIKNFKNSVDNLFHRRKIMFFKFFKKLDLQNFF